MSLSPLDKNADAASAQRASYEAGWVAIHRMIREGGSWSGRERDIAFLNTGSGAFAQVSAVAGLAFMDDGRAVASVDWDLDGDTDLWLANRTAPRVRLLINDSPKDPDANGFVGLRLEGKTQRDAIGARVEVRTAGETPRVFIQTLRAGEGYLSQSSKLLLFGLGRAREIASVSVRWPGGALEQFSGVSPRGWFTLAEGSAHAVAWTPPTRASKLSPGAPILPAPTSHATIPLAARIPMPTLTFFDGNGEQRTLADPQAPFLIVLWASWCAPCLAELHELSAAFAAIEASGVKLVAVSLDASEDRAKAAALLTGMHWPYASLFAEGETIDALDTLQQALLERRRRLALPSSFLVDAKGMLAVMHRGPMVVAQLCAEVKSIEGTAEQIRSRAVPFAGRWIDDPPRPPLDILETRFRERGLKAIADEFQRASWQRIEASPAKLHYDIGVARQRQGRVDLARKEFETALALEPGLTEARIALAYLQQMAGDHAGAIENYSTALREAPHNKVALENVILSLAALKKFDLARERLVRLHDIDAALADRLGAQLSLTGH